MKREELFIVSKLWNSFHDGDRVEPICKKQLADWYVSDELKFPKLACCGGILEHFEPHIYISPQSKCSKRTLGSSGSIYACNTTHAISR